MNISDLLDPDKMKAFEKRHDGQKYTREGIKIMRKRIKEGVEPRDMLEVLNNLGRPEVTEDFSDSPFADR